MFIFPDDRSTFTFYNGNIPGFMCVAGQEIQKTNEGKNGRSKERRKEKWNYSEQKYDGVLGKLT
jgi:hypothetical protein